MSSGNRKGRKLKEVFQMKKKIKSFLGRSLNEKDLRKIQFVQIVLGIAIALLALQHMV